MTVEMNLSFAGAGFIGVYHLGVASCFKTYAPHVLENRVRGNSFTIVNHFTECIYNHLDIWSFHWLWSGTGSDHGYTSGWNNQWKFGGNHDGQEWVSWTVLSFLQTRYMDQGEAGEETSWECTWNSKQRCMLSYSFRPSLLSLRNILRFL